MLNLFENLLDNKRGGKDLNILHLCSYYIGNKLYQKLFAKIEEKELQQIVYVPIKNKQLSNRNIIDNSKIIYFYDFILKKYHRFFYKSKIKKQKKRVELKLPNDNQVSLIHAHTLFSDGGTAFLLHKKYGIKYVVSIRNTDINIFYKYAIQHRRFAHSVLENASAIIFISPSYKLKTLKLIPDSLKISVEEKACIIPNGIDNKWFDIKEKVFIKKDINQINLLFTGELDKNKNLMTVLKLVKKLTENKKNVFLNVAGEGQLRKKLENYAINLGIQNLVEFHGQLSLNELIKLADKSTIFILPSYKETFGISYIEAMSRGIPVIYTRNEGIDGYFPEGRIGYSTDPDNIIEMEKNIEKILSNYEEMAQRCKVESENFDWDIISKKYIKLYKNIESEV